MSVETKKLESYFPTVLKDNNGNPASDINEGLMNLFIPIRENGISYSQEYLVSDFEEGYPDLVARDSQLKDSDYWWWILLMNGLTDPLVGIKANWVYGIMSISSIDSLVADINNSQNSATDERIGEIVELN